MTQSSQMWFGNSLPPSVDEEVYWHFVNGPSRRDMRLKDMQFVGKWMIFVDQANVDDVWLKIGRATSEGLLGIASKVATAKPTRYDKDSRVICVYTRNSNDVDDVKRVRSALRDLGFVSSLKYKTDRDTVDGKYGSDAWLYEGDGDGIFFRNKHRDT